MKTKRVNIIGIAFSFAAAVAYGISQVLIRSGVRDLATPVVGAALALLTGTIVIGLLSVRNSRSNLRQEKKSVGFMLLAGVFAALGIVANYFALSMAPVTLVSPLTATNPLFALVLSFFFLGQLEKITPRVILGTVLIVAGVALVTFGRVA